MNEALIEIKKELAARLTSLFEALIRESIPDFDEDILERLVSRDYISENLIMEPANDDVSLETYDIPDTGNFSLIHPGVELVKSYLNENVERNLFLIFVQISQMPTEVAHYTSLDAGMNIVKHKQIRLTSAATMNDLSDLRGDSVVKYAENSWAFDWYLFSCTEKIDYLNHWRLYGRDGNGTCLVFSPNKATNDMQWGRIRYSPNFNPLRNLQAEFKRKYGVCFDMARDALWQRFVKNSDYEHEQEVRLATFNSEPVDWTVNGLGIISPYVDVKLETEDSPLYLKKIIVGPKADKTNKPMLERLVWEKFPQNSPLVEFSKISHYR